MATPTYDLIDSVTLTSSASSVTFSSITQDYRDLVLVINSPSGAGAYASRFNSDSGSNYNKVWMQGTGSATASQSSSNTTNLSDSINTVQMGIFQIMDYSATDKHKTVLARTDNTTASAPFTGALAMAGRWASTSAVTSWQIYHTGGAMPIGTTVYLYGIAG